MSDYYEEKREQGETFQDFVIDVLIKELGLAVSVYSAKNTQYNKGETRQGIEIKFDDQYKKTGNIYIEIAEKTNKDNPEFIPSGIMRNDNTWLYLIGDYQTIYIFSKKMLKGLFSSGKYLRLAGIPTSKGFLLDKGMAEKYSAKIIKIS